MRSRRALLVLISAVAVAAVSCGVVADTTAATVSGRAVSVADVDRLAADPAFLSLLSGQPSAAEPQESRVDGSAARSALQFELERNAYVALAEDLDLTADAAVTQEAQTWVSQQEAQLQGAGALDPANRELLMSYIESQLLVFDYVRSADARDRSIVQRFYDRLSGRWDQRCITVLGADVAQADVVSELRRGGAGVEEIKEAVEGSEIVVDATEGCVARVDLPSALVSAINRVRTGGTSEAVELDGAVYVVRVEGTRQVPLDEAAVEIAELLQAAAQSGPQALVMSELASATVNPRYGQGVLPTGVVIAPPTPIATQRPMLDALGGTGS